MDPWKYFKIAATAAVLKDDLRTQKLGAVGLRSDGALVCAYNGPAKSVTPRAHAEARLCRKLDYYAIVFVVRVSPTGYGLARPCPSCQRLLRRRRVRRAYYSISPFEYGVMEL